jgi:hypothetical protein
MLQRVIRLLALVVLSSPVSSESSTFPDQPRQSDESSVSVALNLGSMPLVFTKNMGQWPENVLFRTDAGGATAWITTTGVTYQFTRRIERVDADQDDRASGRQTSSSAPFEDSLGRNPIGLDTEADSIETMIIKTEFVSANSGVEVEAEGLMDYKCNYFIGNVPAKWRTDVPNYTAVTLRNVYEGVDLHFSASVEGRLTYQYSIEPGADVSKIKVAYNGGAEVLAKAEGGVSVQTAWGEIGGLLAAPGSNGAVPLERLGLLDDRTPELIIGSVSYQVSPEAVELVYSTFLNGSGNARGDAIAVDGLGCAYVTGSTSSLDFPTQDAYDTTFSGLYYDVFVTKLSAVGGSLVYSTYLGGSSNDYGTGVAVDSFGCTYVIGYTESSDFPTLNAYNDGFGGSSDLFMTKFSNDGNALVYATFLGGSSEDLGIGISVDGSGCACATGYTSSIDFPTQSAYDSTYNGGGSDAFVTKFSATGDSLVFSTFLGGADNDYGYAIAVDDSGCVCLTGTTMSSDFPAQNAYDADYNGGECDAFVVKLSATGNSLSFSTFLGGSSNDYGCGIAVDGRGSAYVTGWTYSPNFPTLNAFDASWGGGGQYCSDTYVTKFSAAGSALYSTFLGGSSQDCGNGIAVDKFGCAFVTGVTSSSDFPSQNAWNNNYDYSTDVFVTEFSAIGDKLVYSTFIGGVADDYGYAIAVDGSSCAYITGRTYSVDFPTKNAFDDSLSGSTYDAFVTKVSFVEDCCSGRVGNVNNSSSDEPTIGDVSVLIDTKFISMSCHTIQCIAEADVNQSGGNSPTCDDITIGDISVLIDYLFITGRSLGLSDCR